MTRLLLFRHAQSHNNYSDAVIYAKYHHDRVRARLAAANARKPDPELSEIGCVQAQQIAEMLVPVLLENDCQPLLISSPMRRALQTALPIATGINLPREKFICHAELFEIGSGYYNVDNPPSRRVEQLEAQYPLTCQAVPSDSLYSQTGRESGDQARARVDRVVAWMEAKLACEVPDLVIVVAHANLLTRWLRRWIGVPWGSGLAFVHGNAAMTTVLWDPYDGIIIESVNDSTHIDMEFLSGGRASSWWGRTMPDLEIEQYTAWSKLPPERVAEVAALREQVLAPEGKSLADFTEADEHNLHFVGYVAGSAVAYAQLDSQHRRLRQLFVAASHRRGRLGRRLVMEAELSAHVDLCQQLEVHTWVESIEFFRRLGYVEDGPSIEGPDGARRRMIKALSLIPDPVS